MNKTEIKNYIKSLINYPCKVTYGKADGAYVIEIRVTNPANFKQYYYQEMFVKDILKEVEVTQEIILENVARHANDLFKSMMRT